MMEPKYKRMLLKLSGEQLSGEHDGGIDAAFVVWVANQVKEALDKGVEVVIMVGGGNYVRGAQVAGNGIDRVTADYMGMLATLMNGIAVADIFTNDAHIDTRVVTSIIADQVADQYTKRRVLSHLHKNRVVILAGGTGRPYLTTDTAAVNLALELNCDVVAKATKVDGIYDKDPAKFSDAKRFEALSYQEAVQNPHIQVMDKAALGLAMEEHVPVVVFDLTQEGNICRVAMGEKVGTLIG